MGGLLEAEKIFFFNKANKNYQQASAYRISDLIKMPSKMTRLKLKNQTTDATAANSVDIAKGNFDQSPLPGKNKTDLNFRSRAYASGGP